MESNISKYLINKYIYVTYDYEFNVGRSLKYGIASYKKIISFTFSIIEISNTLKVKLTTDSQNTELIAK